MKIAVTITTCQQIGIETWQDFHTTKVFEPESTIQEIEIWIKSIDKNASFSNARFSTCVD